MTTEPMTVEPLDQWKSNITVIGAGMAGLLAAMMLRKRCCAVIESQPSLPNNHSALLRFRSNKVGEAIDLPFKKVTVIKSVLPHKNRLADSLSYSIKSNGTASMRSLLSDEEEIVERYIAPQFLISYMAAQVTATFHFDKEIRNKFFKVRTGPVISTLPMPTLMKLLDYGGQKSQGLFEKKSVGGYNITAQISNCDVYATLYVPNPEFPFSRISITGNKLIAECPNKSIDPDVDYFKQACFAAHLIGVPSNMVTFVGVKEQKYAKILPIDDAERKKFISWATGEHQVYSVGRFATWRPGLLLDDVVNDVRQVMKLIDHPHTSYDHDLK